MTSHQKFSDSGRLQSNWLYNRITPEASPLLSYSPLGNPSMSPPVTYRWGTWTSLEVTFNLPLWEKALCLIESDTLLTATRVHFINCTDELVAMGNKAISRRIFINWVFWV